MAPKPDSDPRVFDPAYYLARYPEVKAHAQDPQEHFMTVGWREGKDPSPWFSTRQYLRRYPDVAAAGVNPLLHFRTHGFAEGRNPGLTEAADAGLMARIAALLAAETPIPAAPGPVPADPEARVTLLFGSRHFHAGLCRRQTGLDLPRAGLAAAWLAADPGLRQMPSPLLDAVFYRATYLDGTPEAGEDPLLHFIASGAALGFYPNAIAAAADIRLLGSEGGIDARFYRQSLARPLRHQDMITDYVLHGARFGASPRPGFSPDLVQRLYMRPAGAIGAPWAWVVRNRLRPWVFGTIEELRTALQAVAGAAAFDAHFYAEAAGIDPARVDPALHYLLRGVKAGLPTSAEFHTGHYYATYRDIQRARINPMVHFDRHGRKEGRRGAPDPRQGPKWLGVTPGGLPARSGRPAAIVVSHEASFTGAPIVALNIVRSLAASHDVISWIGKPGPLSPDFEAASVAVMPEFLPPLDALDSLRDLMSRHDIGFAIVNSALSGQMLEALRLAGIATLFLVHDFATYVPPRGNLSRMVLHSDITVFPARIVGDAVRAEMAQMGLDRVPPGLRIAHQGWNGSGRRAAGVPGPAAIRSRLGIAPGQEASVRILFGGGWVQPRKGVDLFLQTAARLVREARADWRFIWVGGNYRPDEDMMVSAFLADHVAKAGLSGRFAHWDEQPDLDSFWSVTDVFFLSSRLDPFPNIALDAIMRDIPVVCFDGATGIAELAPEFPFAVRAVPFADPAEAAAAIGGLIDRMPDIKAEFRAARPALDRAFSFDSYVARLLDFAAEAQQVQAATAARARLVAARPAAEIAAVAAAIPAWARLSPAQDPVLQSLAIATLAGNGGPLPGVGIAADAPLELELPAAPTLRSAAPVTARAGAGAWAIHVFVPDVAALAALGGALAPPPGVPLRLSSPFGDALLPLLPEGLVAEVLPGPAFDGFDGLLQALAGEVPPYLTHLDLATGTDGPARFALDQSFVDRALADPGPAFAMALPDAGPGFLPATALDRFRRLGQPDPLTPVPPRFVALYSSAALAGFLAPALAQSRELRLGLSARETAALLGVLFAAACDRMGAPVLFCPDPLALMAEESEAVVRRGLRPATAAPGAGDRLHAPGAPEGRGSRLRHRIARLSEAVRALFRGTAG